MDHCGDHFRNECFAQDFLAGPVPTEHQDGQIGFRDFRRTTPNVFDRWMLADQGSGRCSILNQSISCFGQLAPRPLRLDRDRRMRCQIGKHRRVERIESSTLMIDRFKHADQVIALTLHRHRNQ